MAKDRKYAAQSQAKAVTLVMALEQRIKLANEQYDVLKKCGLEREARKSILPKIHEMEAQKLQLIERIDGERHECSRQLLLCFCAADLATVAADDLADSLHKASWGDLPDDNDFSAMLRQLASDMNKAVCVIDSAGNKALSCFYADMAEECVAAAKEAVMGVIDRWMATEKGEQYF